MRAICFLKRNDYLCNGCVATPPLYKDWETWDTCPGSLFMQFLSLFCLKNKQVKTGLICNPLKQKKRGYIPATSFPILTYSFTKSFTYNHPSTPTMREGWLQ